MESMDGAIAEWPGQKFHENTLQMVPSDPDHFPPCLFVYPKDPMSSSADIDWPKNVDELDNPCAWPYRLLPPLKPESMLEPTTIYQPEENTKLINKYEVHRFRYTHNQFLAHTEWSTSPVGIGHKKRTADGKPLGGVMLGTRVKYRSRLNTLCETLMRERQLRAICPKQTWKVGSIGGERCGASDARHYLITGWHHGLTRTHIDSGVQAVLYNVVAGRNRFLGVPRDMSIRLSALQNAAYKFVAQDDIIGGTKEIVVSEQNNMDGFKSMFATKILHRCLQYELDVLYHLMNVGMLEYAEASSGEAILIPPLSGHVVLTEDYKIVLASEMHWRQEESVELSTKKDPIDEQDTQGSSSLDSQDCRQGCQDLTYSPPKVRPHIFSKVPRILSTQKSKKEKQKKKKKKKTTHRSSRRMPDYTTLPAMLQAGVIKSGVKVLSVPHKGSISFANLTEHGQIIFEKNTYKSLSSLTAFIKGRPDNGWTSTYYNGKQIDVYRFR